MRPQYISDMAKLVTVIMTLFFTVGRVHGGTDQIPPEVVANSDQWPLPNKDYSSSRAALGGAISSSNIEMLDIAWTYEIPQDQFGNFAGAVATNPIVVDDIVYFQDLRSNIFALNLEDGQVKWQRRYEQSMAGPNGVAVGWGKVFAASGAQSFAALDKETGEELWSVNLARTQYEGIDIQPILFDDSVYLGTAAGTVDGFYVGGTVGSIRALEQATGTEKWLFETVDSEDIWGNPEVNSGGGVWYPPSIDPDRGLMYWGIGNPGPWREPDGFPTAPAVRVPTFTPVLLWHSITRRAISNGITRCALTTYLISIFN